MSVAEGCESDKNYQKRLVDLLEDLPRSGTPPTFSAQQICQIMALACEDPAESDRPISHSTARELADESMKRGIIDSISPRQMGRFLKSVRP